MMTTSTSPTRYPELQDVSRPVQSRTTENSKRHRLALLPAWPGRPRRTGHRPSAPDRAGAGPAAPGSGCSSSAPPARRAAALGRAASPRTGGGLFGVSAALLTVPGLRPRPLPLPPSSGVSVVASSQRAPNAKTNPGLLLGGKGAGSAEAKLRGWWPS